MHFMCLPSFSRLIDDPLNYVYVQYLYTLSFKVTADFCSGAKDPLR